MMDASTTASTSTRELSSLPTTPSEDLIVSPLASPIPRPRPIKRTHVSSSSSAHVPSAPTLPPARALTPTDYLLKPAHASVSTMSLSVVSKKRPSAEFLADSDSPLTDAESVAPSPAKRLAFSVHHSILPYHDFACPAGTPHSLALSSFGFALLSVAVRTPSLAAFPFVLLSCHCTIWTFLVARRPRVLIMHVVDFCNTRHVVLK
ncbi:hypothetical protein C8R48DRAFT_324096 [Suillus tomentosus]|nr:hypothetical protein C8R48DRAFT_324096 [Suillus tomentosus]